MMNLTGVQYVVVGLTVKNQTLSVDKLDMILVNYDCYLLFLMCSPSFLLAYSWYGNYTGLNARPEYGVYTCSGSESSLLNCPHHPTLYTTYFHNDAYCGQTRAVGVKCGNLSSKFHKKYI